MKRLVDLVLATVGLICLLPLLLLIVVWVKLDTPGPVLYRQIRIGRYGKPFKLAKFRTMIAQADKTGPRVTGSRDERITSSGHFLRKWKLDELPQLLNVLIGHMALVGPRPEVPEYVALYPVASRQIILSVRPGLTDYAAIQFRDENELLSGPDLDATYRSDILPKKITLYEKYVRDQSLTTDLRLLAHTFRVVFFGPKTPRGH